MRAFEFILEGKKGKMEPTEKRASKDMYQMRDDGIDRAYHLNRVMMAAACHDGKSPSAVKGVDAASWADKYNTAHPYTKEESNMVQGAIKTIGGAHHKIVGDSRSMELDDVHKTSPMSGFKGYSKR